MRWSSLDNLRLCFDEQPAASNAPEAAFRNVRRRMRPAVLDCGALTPTLPLFAALFRELM